MQWTAVFDSSPRAPLDTRQIFHMMVALSNLAHLSNADFRGPRVDWRDLEQHCRGELICLTGAPMVGVLSPLVENAADPSNPTEAVALTRRLAELFPHLYIELAYHHPGRTARGRRRAGRHESVLERSGFAWQRAGAGLCLGQA